MVHLTRIYTRTGDTGMTHLGDMSRTSKNDPRLVAYADVSEANAAIGVALAAGDLRPDVRTTLLRVQNDLFDVGADLCNPLQERYEHPPLRVDPAWIEELEADCDRYLAGLDKLSSFILPGGTPGAAHLHLATTVVRRAERAAWAAVAAYGEQPGTGTKGEGGINPLTAKYLNRLSDLLFVLARVANLGSGGDILWRPGGGRTPPPGVSADARTSARPRRR